MSLTYVKLFFSYKTDFEALDNGEIGSLLMGALDYAEHHIEPVFTGNEKIIWPMIRGQIDREQQSYEELRQKRKAAINSRYEKTSASEHEYKSIQTYTSVSKKKKKNKEYEEEFNLFWSAYPRKQCKGDAAKVWNSLRPPLDKVLEAIDKQKHSVNWIKDNGQYIPYPAKWLKGLCWEDEVEQGMLYGHVHIDASNNSSYENFDNQLDELNKYD